MNFEILFILVLFLSSLVMLFTEYRKAVFVLLALSVLLHKELFSIYSWNILPVRVFMLALLVYIGIRIIYFIKTRDTAWLHRGFEHPVGLSLLSFWVIAGVSLIFSRNIVSSLSMYAFLTTILALYIYLAVVLEEKKEKALSVIKAYILTVLILSLIGYLQLYVFSKFQFIFGAFWNIPGHTPRIGSLFWDVNHFAGLLVLLLPVISALVITSKGKGKLFYLVTGLSVSVTLLLTNARSGWIAGGVSFLVFVLIVIFRRLRYRGLAIIFTLVLLVSGGIFSQYLDKSSPIRHKIRQYFHYRLDSFDSHFLLITGSWQIFEKYPVLGGGYGSFFEQFSKTKISATYFARDPAALNTRVPAHSIWGELLAETGIVGFTSMAVFYFGIISTLLYASLRLKHKTEYVITAAMTGSVSGILIAGIFYSYNSEFFWITLFLYFFYALYCLRDEFRNAGHKLWSEIYSLVLSHPKFPFTALLVLSFILIFSNLSRNHLIPFDEAIYAKVSNNIVQTNNWLTLSWREGIPWFEKPPLYFWLSALLLKVLPESPELAVKLPSAIFGLLTILFTYQFGKRLFGKTAGFIAGIALLTTFHYLYYSRIGMLDVTCTFFIVATLYFYHQAKLVPYLILAGSMAGFAVLTKGIIGIFPLLIIGLYELVIIGSMLVSNHRSGHKVMSGETFVPILKVLTVILTSSIIFLPWHLLMYQMHGSTFVDSYLGYHVFERVTAETEDKNASFFWYLVVLKVSMRLWFIALIPTVVYTAYAIIKNNLDRRNLVLVVLWALLIFTAFSVSKSKLVWYIMPIYPALSILIGYFMSSLISLADRTLSRVNYISSFFLKSSLICVMVIVSLLYLFINKRLVYVSDLTGPQVLMMQARNSLYGSNSLVYLDRVEIPLALFYNNGPFEIVDYSPLRQKLNTAEAEGRKVIFITKESRFNNFQKEHPSIRFIASSNEWYLGELPGK